MTMASLYGAVLRRLDDVSDRVVDQIRADMPDYADVPVADHQQTVRELCRVLLTSLSKGAAPADADLQLVERTARRRAEQGVPVQHVMGAFHVAFQQIWQLLVEEGQTRGADGAALIATVGPVWQWIHVLSAAVADAHAEVTGSRHAAAAALRQRFLAALRETGEDNEQAEDLARQLGLDPAADFRAWCGPAGEWPAARVDSLQSALTRRCPPALCGVRGSTLLVIAPAGVAAAADAVVRRMLGPECALGVGLCRSGITGAAASVGDAERVMLVARARGGGAVSFEDEWLLALAVTSEKRLQPLLSAGHGVSRAHPHLAEAVAAFAAAGFSVSAAAHSLHVHPNTAGYRLARWHELTGWDPRTPDGLMRSLVCLGLAGTAGGGLHDVPGAESVPFPKTG